MALLVARFRFDSENQEEPVNFMLVVASNSRRIDSEAYKFPKNADCGRVTRLFELRQEQRPFC